MKTLSIFLIFLTGCGLAVDAKVGAPPCGNSPLIGKWEEYSYFNGQRIPVYGSEIEFKADCTGTRPICKNSLRFAENPDFVGVLNITVKAYPQALGGCPASGLVECPYTTTDKTITLNCSGFMGTYERLVYE